MISISIDKQTNKLVINSSLSESLSIRIDGDIKWTENSSKTGLISATLPTEYFASKYGGRLALVNKKLMEQTFSSLIEELQEENVSWYNATTGAFISHGFYYSDIDYEITSVYGNIELINGEFFINAYLTLIPAAE